MRMHMYGLTGNRHQMWARCVYTHTHIYGEGYLKERAPESRAPEPAPRFWRGPSLEELDFGQFDVGYRSGVRSRLGHCMTSLIIHVLCRPQVSETQHAIESRNVSLARRSQQVFEAFSVQHSVKKHVR